MFAFDAFDLFTGFFSIVLWIFAIIGANLPSKKMDSLEEILKRTETLLQCVVEEGILKVDFVAEIRSRLLSVNNRIEDLFVQTHAAVSIPKQYMEICKGLSCKLSTLHGEAKTIRADIYSRRAEARRKAEELVFPIAASGAAVAHSEHDAVAREPLGPPIALREEAAK